MDRGSCAGGRHGRPDAQVPPPAVVCPRSPPLTSISGIADDHRRAGPLNPPLREGTLRFVAGRGGRRTVGGSPRLRPVGNERTPLPFRGGWPRRPGGVKPAPKSPLEYPASS